MRQTGWALIFAVSLGITAYADDYADARLCATCHRKIDQSFKQTGMGRSIVRPAPSNTIEDYQKQNQFLHSRSGTYYAMSHRGGEYFQRRWEIGFDGKESNVEELRIDYVIGSGNHARSYLHRAANGGYIELPLGWYAEKSGYWAMSPGFDTAHPATRRYVSYECIFCHDAIPSIPAGHDRPGSDPTFTGDLPEGIDCQRCHGPGAKHIRTAGTAGATVGQIRSSIVNPAKLSPALQLDLCMQCHLEPTSTEFPSLIRRFNRGPFSYLPGEPLSNFVLAFDHAPGTGHDDKFEIVNSSAYRLRKSQCFLKSQGRLTCITCHDPHAVRSGTEALNHYSGVCRQCHAPESLSTVHRGAGECISCHMPKRRTEDVVHVVMTDHFIQREPPARDLLADLAEQHPAESEQYRGEVVPYYPSILSAGDALYRAAAQVMMRNNLENGAAELSRELRQFTADPEFYMILGQAWLDLRKPAEAAAAYDHVLRTSPNSVRAMLALAQALAASRQFPQADQLLRRAIRAAPASAPAWFQLGTLDFAAGRNEQAIADMTKAVSIEPDMAGARTGLAELLMRAGKTGVAEQELRAALVLDPYDATARDLLGRVLAGNRQMDEALFHFERATRVRSGYAPHLYDFALALSAVNRLDEARAVVDSALRADSSMPEAHALRGNLLAAQGHLEDAIREYKECIRLNPDFARVRLDLARALVAQGDTAAAIEELRKAAADSNADVARLATQLLHQLGR